MADELKRKNEELMKQNAAYKEDIDDLRNQLWSLGDKLLLNEQTKKRDEDRLSLSRQFDRINLQSVDSWVRIQIILNCKLLLKLHRNRELPVEKVAAALIAPAVNSAVSYSHLIDESSLECCFFSHIYAGRGRRRDFR